MKKYNRVFVIVIDSLGVGAMPDAQKYGDGKSNTFAHIWAATGGVNIPNLLSLGMGRVAGIAKGEHKKGYCMKLSEASVGKDTMTGHWEMMGIRTKQPFLTFAKDGFPEALIVELEKQFGKAIVGNKATSGTEILDEMADEEIKNDKVIVYTSADSVLQIPGHEDFMGVQQLYRYCEIAREVTMREEWRVGRVIARPYVGMRKGEFKRTQNRKDYALKPPGKTVLNLLKDHGYEVMAIGKIEDIFSGEGITQAVHSQSSVHGMEQTIQAAMQSFEGLCFTNLVDFDALWGHRRDPKGYGAELERFDEQLGKLIPHLLEDDLLLITADHGNDPTYAGTDHTREFVPLLAYAKSMTGMDQLDTQDSFGAIGATIAENFGIPQSPEMCGESILTRIK